MWKTFKRVIIIGHAIEQSYRLTYQQFENMAIKTHMNQYKMHGHSVPNNMRKYFLLYKLTIKILLKPTINRIKNKVNIILDW